MLTIPAFSLRTPSKLRTSPVNVCFVIDRLCRAGTETQLLALIRHLDRSRVRPTLCLLNGNDSESQALLPADCPTIDLGLTKLFSFRTASAASRLARFWREHRIDVVQSYLIDSTYFAVPLARLFGIRSVVRVRNNIGYFLTPFHRRLGRVVGRLAHVTLSNSPDGVRALVESEGLTVRRVRLMENGVDLDRFPVGPEPMSRGTIRVGAVANLRPVKNIEGLIRAAERLPGIQFDVAGAGEQRMALENQIRTANLSVRFRLLGPIADVPSFLANVDIAVLCSHSESMSNSLLEYMAVGRAIVATDVGANAAIARPERDALIVPPGDDAALADAIRQLATEPDLAQRLGRAARARVERCYSRAAMVWRFEEFFEKCSHGSTRMEHG